MVGVSDPRRGVPLLLEWFAREGRDLPWRHTYRPYEVLLSEILLQQTRMEAAVPYFLRFLERFPTLEALAGAPEEEVLALWTGLGYYRRARSLREAAARLIALGYREPPEDEGVLRSLPGLGSYTVGAVRSIAYNLPAPAVDGNVVRVLARWFDLPGTFQGKGRKELEALALSLIPPGRARDCNQALMELGALVCVPSSPRCPVCPLVSCCLARWRGTEALRPEKVSRGASVQALGVAGLVRHRGKLLLRRRPPRGLWAGFWEFPWRLLEEGEDPGAALGRELAPLLGEVEIPPPCCEVRHAFLRTRVRLLGFLLDLPEGWEPTPGQGTWWTLEEAAGLPASAGCRKLLERLRREDGESPRC